MRLTSSLVQVALVLGQDPSGKHYGYDLIESAGVKAGTLYPILKRMEDAGWLAGAWQHHSDTDGRPCRRYYTVTEKGRHGLADVLESARLDLRFEELISGSPG